MKKRIRVVLFVSLSFVQILIAMFIVVKKWLRTAFETDSAVVKTIEDGMFSGNGVVYPAYVRPALICHQKQKWRRKNSIGVRGISLKSRSNNSLKLLRMVENS